MLKQFISYNGLPISSGGAHSINNKRIEDVYSQTEIVLNKYGQLIDKECILTFYNSPSGLYKTWGNLWVLMRKFGFFSKFGSFSYPEGRQYFWSWKINKHEVRETFKLLESFNALDKDRFDPLVFSVLYHFYFKNDVGDVFPCQDEIPTFDERFFNSQVYIRLGQKASASVWFTVPLGKSGADSNYIKRLIQDLPFKVSEKHWKIWGKSSKGKWMGKKIRLTDFIDG
ncbi:hypothetical protein FUA48_00020 [Flavobacterium alkalisoli]|uniref:Uncharacterized protein n=1 Tax=Flavobacterium alkalisoli TaxID=2602769 RepID=A0A5B9FNX1_9FLAO|nr:hypothetical protein [Flavobacterium alkalisoli]QEE48019.1 hypothetical protein FUA48_00020 [Flavobacterium alkalisoli]